MDKCWRILLFWACTGVVAGYDSVYEGDPMDASARDSYVQYSQSLMEGGRSEYDKIVQFSSIPSYGDCWTEAVANLHSSCRQLTEKIQKKLAFDLAACFVALPGQPKIVCLETADLGSCAQNQSVNFFNSFLHFFTHAQSICYYLNSELFQRRVERQVSNLLDASATVTNQLGQSAVLQSQLLEQQQAGLETQKAVMDQHRSALDSVGEIRLFLGNMADRISTLQNVFLDEFSGFYSVVFYFCAAMGCFIFTATKRTQRARFWVFILLVLTFVLERFINKTKVFVMSQTTHLDELVGILSSDAWVLRHVFLFLVLVVIIYSAFTYVDYAQINWDMTAQILRAVDRLAENQNKDLIKQRLEAVGAHVEQQALNGEVIVNMRGKLDSVDGAGERGALRPSLSRPPLSAFASRPGSSAVSETRSLDSENDMSGLLAGMNDRYRRSPTPSRSFSQTPLKPKMGISLAAVREDDQDEDDLPSSLPTPTISNGSRSPANFGKRLLRGLISAGRSSREPTPEDVNRELHNIKRLVKESASRPSGSQGTVENGTSGDLNGEHTADSDSD